MTVNKCILFFLLAVSFAGCSIAPINGPSTATTLGEGNTLARGSIVFLGAALERGVGQNLDIGAAVELQGTFLVSAYGKYAVLNRGENGFSAAMLGGIGYGPGDVKSKSVYGGPIFSYRKGNFEFFTGIRANYVDWDFHNLKSDSKDNLFSFIPNKDHFIYWQGDIGGSLYNDNIVATVGLKIFKFDDSSSGSPFFDIGYKF